MRINHKKMHKDILKRLNAIGKSQDFLSKKLEIGRSTIWRLSKGKEISTTNFFKIIEWLDNGIEEYIILSERTPFKPTKLNNTIKNNSNLHKT